jgi:hypothetical protein
MPARNSKSIPSNYMEEDEVIEALNIMEEDGSFMTESSYSANATLYPDNKISFKNKQLAYLKSHPQVNPEQFLANLRLMTKIR